jgi:ectoine hydroxylase-related dioxygenase (phytanoyl-CoA dioxygenase family)
MLSFEDLESDGFKLAKGVLGPACRRDLIAELMVALGDSPAGLRGLAHRFPRVARLARSHAVRALVEPVLGPGMRLVRSLLFNKGRGINWQVGWHQDLTIAVQRREQVAGYDGWSTKDGIEHVQPPLQVLERMVTIRLHLDPADATNGALWVSPGSHRMGRLRADEAARVAEHGGRKVCAVEAGDAVMLRPLLLHASGKSLVPAPRRVIHLEFAAMELPLPLAWVENA